MLLALTGSILIVATPTDALACSVCYGAGEGPVVRGLQLSTFALLGVTYFVIGGLLASFLLLRRRARMAPGASREGVY